MCACTHADVHADMHVGGWAGMQGGRGSAQKCSQEVSIESIDYSHSILLVPLPNKSLVTNTLLNSLNY